MNNPSSSSKKIKPFLSFLLIMFVGILTMFTFSACKLTNDTGNTESSFDASGRLKISTPFVEFNKYSVDANGKNIVDDNSGSFTWTLEYFYSGADKNKIKDIGFDQIYLMSNIYKDKEYTEIEPTIKPNHYDAKDKCFYNDIQEIKNEDGTVTKVKNVKLYAKVLELTKENISFPSYEIVVDGKYYTFRVTLNKSALGQISFEDIAKKYGAGEKIRNIFTDNSTDNSLFKFEYSTGKNNGVFYDCPAGLMTYYVDSTTGEFKIRFNPQLEAGSVNRYLKVRALAEGFDTRGNSNYSSTVSFEAYAMSFEAYSPNSSTLDYGGLVYDSDKYYFAYKKTYFDTRDNSNAIKSLTGYFPEGRKVVVSRKTPLKNNGSDVVDYNYALQSWTMNAPAENSNAIKDKFPALSSTNGFSLGYDVLSSETLKKSNAFQVIKRSFNNISALEYQKKGSVSVNDIMRFDQHGNLTTSSVVYNYSPDGENETDDHKDQLIIASQESVNGFKFYANYVKVRGFMLSGTFFAGDNFFTAGSQELTDVTINLFYKLENGEYTNLNLANGSNELPRKDGDTVILDNASHPNKLQVTINGSYFKVIGLEKDDYLVFSKDGASLTGEYSGVKPYSFHSPLMTDREAYNSTFKALDLVLRNDTTETSAKTIFADRQDVGIIGTQYAEQSNLIVNLYRLKDAKNGETESVPSTYLELLKDSNISYEIIKSVSSIEDENGYITTNIIISLILPSNATLTGYNLETIGNVTKQYFKNEAGTYYVSFSSYNPSTMEYDTVDINGNKIPENDGNTTNESIVYQIIKKKVENPSADIKETAASEMIKYNEQYYSYDHREVGGNIANALGAVVNDAAISPASMVFYKSLSSSSEATEFLVKLIDSSGLNWYTLTYKTKNVTASMDDKLNVTMKVDNVEITALSTAGDIYNVSTVANAYATDMMFEDQNVYIYYDVKNVGSKYYYTAPIGKRVSYTSSDSNTSNVTINNRDELYFDQISNFASLKGSKIMLGSDIYKSTSSLAQEFRNAIGSKIILSCYYYIAPVGSLVNGNYEPTELYFRQYLVTGETNETQTITTYVDASGKTYSNPEVEKYEDGENKDKVKYSYKTGFFIYDPNSIKINADATFALDQTSNHIYSSISGTTPQIDEKGSTHNKAEESYNFIYSDSNEFEFTVDGVSYTYKKDQGAKKAGDSSTYKIIANTTSNGLRKIITMYRYVPGTQSGFVKTRLYYNEENNAYYQIIGSSYIYYTDDNNNQCVGLFDIYDTKEIKFTFKGNDTYLNSITATSMTIGEESVQVKETVGTRRVWGPSGHMLETAENYYCYVVTTFSKYDGANEVERYYPVLKRTENEQDVEYLAYNFSPQLESITNYVGVKEDGSKVDLYAKEETITIPSDNTSLKRTAQTAGNEHVTVLGKYIITNDIAAPKIYPSFSSLLKFSESDAYILDKNRSGETNYYNMDYTTTKNAIEGFPGVTLLAGLPYPNPVLNFKVKHKAYESPIINIALDIDNAYFVELLGTNIASDDSNLIRDFTTYAFRDTLENLTQNDYIDKAYWILDRENYRSIYALVEADEDNYSVAYNGKFYEYYIYTISQDENENEIKVPSELTIQNVGLNSDEEFLYANTASANGRYSKPLYMEYVMSNGQRSIKKIETDDVVLWKTGSSTITDAPTFDIHSYVQGKDGIIYFNSGSSFDDNIICNGLSGISAGATKDASGNYNYDEVMISGVTFAYRTLASQVNNSTNMSGYQFDKMINILNAFDSKEAYFRTGLESVVMVASPVVQVNGGDGNSYVYRFKEWKIYQRYNSEVLFYNRGLTENLQDRTNAILRFTSYNAGYFVIMPVYERVFNIDTGVAVIDGSINQGGGIQISYNNGDELDVKNRYDDDLYFVNYLKTNYQSKPGYYYGNLTGYPFLYFTGKYTKVGEKDEPVFEKLDNVYVLTLDINIKLGFLSLSTGNAPLFFQLTRNSSGNVTGVNFLNIITSLEKDKPGLVYLQNDNGQYYFYGFKDNLNGFEDRDGYYLKNGNVTQTVKFKDIVNVSFTAKFFYDSITESNSGSTVPLHYSEGDKSFRVLEVDDIAVGEGENKTPLLIALLLYNLKNNTMLFTGGNSSALSKLKIGVDSSFNLSGLGNCIKDEVIATSSSNKFTVVDRVENARINGLYLSRLGSLNAGELLKDENGNLYSTQQFKTAYIDRDSYVELHAIPQTGYRFEGWYKCVYDQENNFWYTTDEKVTNSDDIYSDEIIQGYHNEESNEYYYVTSYKDTTDTGVIKYYYDSDKTKLALVPERMLDKVRGFFINTGSKKAPNYVQVYRKVAGLGEGNAEYYFDATFINKVDQNIYDVEERTYLSSIRTSVYGENKDTFYFLSNVAIYYNENNGRYYRSKETGNVVVEGDVLKINKLHSNVRYVAKFIETYNEYIFAEDEESSGIQIQAVYYSNSTPKYDADGNVTIRTDVDGNNLTAGKQATIEGKNDREQNNLDQTLFGLYEDESKHSGKILNLANLNSLDKSKYNNFGKFESLLNGFGVDTATYRVNSYIGEGENRHEKLNLQSMYFDIDTRVTIVVRVKADFELSIHSLGVNSRYVLTPIFSPTNDFVKANQKAKEEDKVDYLFYIFQVTYDRNPENEYRKYIVHPDRGENFAYDALVGNYMSFYSKYFKSIDNFGNEIGFVNGKLTESYLNSIRVDGNKIDENIINTIKSRTYKNIEKALYDLCFEMKKPGTIIAKSIKLRQSLGGQYTYGKVISNTSDMIGAVQAAIKKYDDAKGQTSSNPYLIRNGYRNFINLSTIPIFNFTVQALVIDSEGDEIVYDEKTNKIILPSNEYEIAEGKPLPVWLSNTVYVAGGINEKRFLGAGNVTKLTNDPYYYKRYDNGLAKDSFAFKERVDGLEYVSKGTAQNTMLFQDLSFVQNTIVLFQGIDKDNSPICGENSNYIFAGWYEQKYDRVSETWSDLVFMSADETTPYVSLSTADTVIVAVYKRAVKVTFTYDSEEMAYEMSNGLRDSAGNELTYELITETEDGLTKNVATLTGRFFFDAKIEAVVSPAGGYRFDSIHYVAKNGLDVDNGDVDLSKVQFYNYNAILKIFTKCAADKDGYTHTSAHLNSIIKLEFNLNTAIRSGSSANVCDTLELDFRTKKVTLLYVLVENYSATTRRYIWPFSNNHSGYNFLLIRKSTNEILLSTGKWLINRAYDDTNTKIVSERSGTDLYFYGYFDSDKLNDLVLITKKDTSTQDIKEWYINGIASDDYTSNYSSLNSNYDYKGAYYKFDINPYYEGENAGLNDLFGLDKNNAVYFAKAHIEGQNNAVSISHKLFEDVSDLGDASKTGTVPTGATVNTLLSFNGTIIDYGESGQTLENEALALNLENEFTFSTNSTLNLTAFSNYIIYNGNLYVFVGWFHYAGDSEDQQSGTFNLISKDASALGEKAAGMFEARYVRANKVISSIDNADITFEATEEIESLSLKPNSKVTDKILTTYGQIGGVDVTASNTFEESAGSLINYVLVGSSLNFSIIPAMDYLINSCSVVGSTSGTLETIVSSNRDYVNGKDYTVKEVPANNVIFISATIQKGYVIKIKQTKFANIMMTGDGISLDSQNYIAVTIDGDTIVDERYGYGQIVVASGTKIKLVNTNNSDYFIGFFVNGGIAETKEIYELEITQDVTIEARYSQYAYIKISSLIGNDSSSVSGFSYTLEYVNPKTGSKVKIEQIGTIFQIPAGITAHISVATYASGYKFVGLKTISNDGIVHRTLSTNSETDIVLTRDLSTVLESYNNNTVNVIYIVAVYEKTTSIKILKDVIVSNNESYLTDGAGKNVTKEQFDGMFNITLTYTDPSGNEKTISTSSKSELSRIEIEKGSSLTIKPSLDSAIAHRYMVYDFDFKVSGYSRKDLVTKNADGTYFIGGDQSYSDLVFIVYFKPCDQITLVKEVVGSPDDENITIDYSYTNSNNFTEKGTLKSDSEIDLNIQENGAFSFTANIADEDRYMFVGWFNNGVRVSTERTITQADIQNPNTIAAKFIKIINITNISRVLIDLDGREQDVTSSTDFGDVYVTGNFIEGNSYSVQTKSLAEIVEGLKTGIKIVAGTKLSLATNHYAGYVFYRFRIVNSNSKTFDEYSLKNNNADAQSDGHSAVTTAIDYDFEICADFEKPYNITYFVSTTNTEGISKNGFTLNQSTSDSYYSHSSYNNRISFVGLLSDGYVMDSVEINGKVVPVTEQDNKFTMTIPDEFVGKALVVQINVSKQTTVSVYVSFDGISDASKFSNLGQIDISIKNTHHSLPSFSTMVVSNSQIKAYEDVKVYIKNSSYTHNGKTYRFDGFYLYDGTSTSTSISPIVYDNEFNFVANKDVAIVAKFESSKLPATVVTKYYNDNGETDFVGWYARINNPDNAEYYEDILISTSYSDKVNLDGKYSLVYAKYQTSSADTIQINGDDASEGHAAVYSSSDIYLGKNTTISVSDDNKTISIANVYGTIETSFIASAGFEITNKNNNSCTVVKKIYEFIVKTNHNRVSSNEIGFTTDKDKVTIIEQAKDVSLTLKLPEGVDSTFFANITESTISQNVTEYTIDKANNTLTITVPSASIISLFYQLAIFEKFAGFKITVDGKTTIYTENFMDYELPEAESVTIEILIGKASTTTIYENDDTKGSASVIEEGDLDSVNIIANQGFAISEILVAEISRNGVLGDFQNIFAMTNDELIALFGTQLSSVKNSSEKDSFDEKYIKQIILSYNSNKNIAIKVAYKKITTVRFNITIGEDEQILTKYFDESQNPLTLAKINALDIASKVNTSDYVLSHYLYSGEIITNTTEIELADNIIDIVVSFNRGYKTVVKPVVRSYENVNLATPTSGIKVTLGESTVVSTATTFNVFKYVFSETLAIKAEDTNGYFEFLGYYFANSDSINCMLTSISSYTFTVADYGRLETENIDGEDVYVIYAIFTERVETLVIDKDYESDDFNLYLNDEKLNATNENQFIEVTDYGNVAYRYENGQFIITYSYSILSSNFKLKIRQDGFERNTTDPLLGTQFAQNVSVFHEKQIDGVYYRFDNFYNANDFIIGEKYNNSLEISLKDYRVGGHITAKLIKLNQIEYVSDVSNENITIKIEILTIVNGQSNYIEIASRTNKTTFGAAKIIYRAEEGTTLRVFVDFKNYDLRINFSSIIFTRNSASMISKVFGDGEEISKIDWKAKLNGYMAVSSFYDSTNTFNQYISSDGTVAFNFTATEDVSFVADFTGGLINFKKTYIVASLYTPNNSSYYENVTGSTENTISGKGFSFTTGANGQNFNLKDKTEREKKKDESRQLYNYDTTTKNVGDGSSNNVVKGGQLNFHTIVNRFATLTVSTQIVSKSELLVGYKNFTTSVAEKIKVGEVEVELNSQNNVFNNGGNKNLKYNITAPAIQGYIFKGFAIVSASYGHAFNVVLIGGNTGVAPSEQFTMIGYGTEQVDGTVKRFTATNVSLSGDTTIVAVYEPKVYIITVNTYKYFEDAKDKLHNSEGQFEEIEAATIKGSLLVQRNDNCKLTSISYQFSQFVGFTTIDDFHDQIYYYYDTGKGQSVEDLTLDSKPKLLAGILVPGQNDDGSYRSSAARNNFYAIKVQQDFTVNFYYTALSYNLTIDLTDIETTYNYNQGTQGTSTSYLAYSDEVRNKSGWENPSAGDYTYTNNYGTNDITTLNADCTYTIRITANDPYVYVSNDSNGTTIGYPTKISNALVEARNGYLYYVNKNVIVKDAKGNNIELITNKDDQNRQVEVHGFSYNQPYLNSNGKVALRNIFDFVNINKSGIPTLKDNILKIEQDSIPFSINDLTNSGAIKIDLINGTIQIKLKVIATDAGFPIIKISQKDLKTNEIIMATFDNKSTERKQRYSEKGGRNEIEGFNMALFEGNDQFDNENFELGNIDVNLIAKWQTLSKPVEAEIKIANSNGKITNSFTLTGKGTKGKAILSSSGCEADCGSNPRNYLKGKGENHDEIISHQIYIVKNGYTIMKWLNAIAMRDPNKELLRTPSDADVENAGKIYGEIMSSAVGEIDGYAKLYTDPNNSNYAIGTGATGQLLSNESRRSLAFLLLEYVGVGFTTNENDILGIITDYVTYANKLSATLLTYRCIDAYELYKKGIDGNFYNNSINASDLVINQTILAEHVIDQENNYKKVLFLPEFLWTAAKGYAFFKSASATYSVNRSSGTFTADYANSLSKASADVNDKTKRDYDRKFYRNIAELFNSAVARAGTYNRFITVALAPNDEEFTGNTSMTATVQINNNNDIVLTRLFDYDPTPLSDILISIGTGLGLGIIASLIPGGMLLLGAIEIALIGGIVHTTIADPRTKYNSFTDILKG